MILGIVTADLEATVPLEVQNSAGQALTIEAVVDTGFDGYLTLPIASVAALGLVWMFQGQGILADGSVAIFSVYEGHVLWENHLRPVEIEAIDIKPLLGMGMLAGHRLEIEAKDGGNVVIEPLP